MLRSPFARRALPFFAFTLPLTFAGFLAAQAVHAAPFGGRGGPVAQVAVAAPQAQAQTPAQAQPRAQVQAPAQTSDARVILAQGVVRDTQGKPIKGALVAVQHMTREAIVLAPPVTAQTDETGRFLLQAAFSPDEVASIQARLTLGAGDLSPDGQVTEPVRLPVIIQAPGRAMQQRMLRAAFMLPPGAPALPLPANELKLEPGLSARGQVVDAEGKPLAGVVVRPSWVQLSLTAGATPYGESHSSYISLDSLSPDSPLLPRVRVVTDAGGNFTLPDLPSGQARVALDDPRYAKASALALVQEAGEGGAGQEQNPEADGAQTVARLTARPGAQIKGRVQYPGGKPAGGVMVATQSKAGRAQAITRPDGTYLLTGLDAGEVTVAVAPPSKEWAVMASSPLQAKAGTVDAGTLTLSPGLMLRGTVREDGSNAPLAGAEISMEGPAGLFVSGTSDTQGRYQIRTLPGEYRFYVSQVPPDYVEALDNSAKQVVTAASPLAPNFVVRRGLTLSGTVLDDKGQPAVGAVLAVQSDFGQDTVGVVDAQGHWTVRGINPQRPDGKPLTGVTIKTSGAWDLLGGPMIKLPNLEQIAPFKLVVVPLKLQDVTVRVVTTEGEPVPGAQVNYTLYLDATRRTTMQQTATSDARGQVVFPQMRPEQGADLSATKAGYATTQPGLVLPVGLGEGKANGGARTRDIVMSAQNAQVSGRVLDAQGQPTAGVRVAALSPGDLRDLPDTSVLTDDQGRFTLKSLMPGEVVLGAAKGRAFGTLTVQANLTKPGAAPVAQAADLKLGPEEAMTPPTDVAGSWTQLENRAKALKEANADQREMFEVAWAAVQLAAYDPERAQRAVVGPNGQQNDLFLYLAPISMARTNPQLALKWGPVWMAQWTMPELKAMRSDARLRLATLTVAADPAAARATYEEVATATVPTDQSRQSIRLYAELATLASALHNPDADGWLQALTLSINAQVGNQQQYAVADAVRLLGDGDIPTMRRWAGQLPPQQQLTALSALAKVVAKRDSQTARAILGDMQALLARPDFPRPQPRADNRYQPDPADTLNQAREEVAKILMTTDLPAAREVADALPAEDTASTLLRSEIAALGAGAGDADALRRSLEAAGKSWGHPAGNMARLAALMSPTLPPLGAQGFVDARRVLGTYKSQNQRYGEEEPAAYYAYALAPFDPAQSRLLLENEWQRATTALRQNKGKREDGLWRNTNVLTNVVRAMLPLSLSRANEMMGEISVLIKAGAFPENTVDLQQQTMEWLLSDDKARQMLVLDRRSAQDDF